MLALAISVILLSTGCSGSPKKADPQVKKPEDKIQIGITFDTFVVERWLRDRDVFVSTAEKNGAEVNVQNANGSVDDQIAQIRYFIQKKMDVIVIVAVDGEKLLSVVKSAKDAGIKVIAYDRLIMNADVDLYISFDNEEVGRLMAQSLVDNLPDGGNIFEICGPTSDNNVLMVDKGFQEVISQSKLKVVHQEYCDGWVAEQAFDAVNRGLAETTDVNGVMCGNDDLASQAFRALAESRLANQVFLVGQDADLAACQRIVEGTQLMTVYKPVANLAKEAAAFAVLLADGGTPEVPDTINDGTYDVPYESLDPVAVTRENIDKVIIDSGFHLREDVYLNVKQ